MKKTLSILLSTMMIAALMVGCGSKTDEVPSSKNESTSIETQTETNKETENKAPETTTANDKSADIVIIGAGGAGMTAAIQAVQDGAKNVVIVEKASVTGGNTIFSTGGLNASETEYQKKDGIEDSNDLYYEDTMKGGKNLNNPELVRFMVENSKDAVDWVNSIGGDLSVVGMFGGASVKRIHRPSDTSAVGPMLVKTLNAKVAELNIPVLLNTKAEEILTKDGVVTGVKVKDENGEYVINAKSVIITTGGFGANSDMVVSYKPNLAGFNTTNAPTATGDGIKMAEAIGADLVDMDQIQTHPTVNPDTRKMYTEGVRGNGAILLNKDGKRFVNELETRDVVSAAILEQKDKVAYLVFDQSVRDSLKAIESYIKAGIVFEADTIEGLAEQIGVPADAFKATVASYTESVKNNSEDEFKRADRGSDLSKPKYYAALCAPAVHHTMGGIKINTNNEVINKEGNIISGLYAAGEVTGGVHGGNRLGGNAVTDIVVFGRNAGSNAHKYVLANGGMTDATITVEKKEEAAVPTVKGNFKDGEYTGKAMGNNGDVTVKVTVKDSSIVSIEMTEHAETDGLYQGAYDGVTKQIIETQKLEGIDTVTGATNTSNAIINAVTEALKDAQ